MSVMLHPCHKPPVVRIQLLTFGSGLRGSLSHLPTVGTTQSPTSCCFESVVAGSGRTREVIGLDSAQGNKLIEKVCSREQLFVSLWGNG